MSSPKNRLISSAEGLETFTPSDSVSFTDNPARGIILPEDGAIKVTSINGEEITIPNLLGGMIHPIACTKVFETGTDAGITSVTLVR